MRLFCLFLLGPLSLMAQASEKKFKFSGIAKLSNCSASVVRFEGQSVDSKAMLLTNGHCLGKPFIAPDSALSNTPLKKKVKIFTNENFLFKTYTEKLLYATMTSTDIALFELGETYRFLKELGIEAFTLSKRSPFIGMKVEVYSGFKNSISKCSVEDIVEKLQESSWFFKDSIRYTQEGCVAKGGTSGSPILEENSRSIVGINNTRNVFGLFCRANNPCEIDKNEVKTARRGASYGQQTSLIYSCLNADLKIETTLASCLLPKSY